MNERVFQPIPDLNSVQFGADPHVVLEPGQTFATEDQHLAAELAENPFLEEVTPAAKPKKAASKVDESA